MFLEWISCLFYIGLVIYAELVKRRNAQTNSSSQAIENDLFTDEMSEFEKAAAFVNAGRYPYSDAAKLALYGLYKQATKGDNTTTCPSSIDFVGVAKWNSWKSHQGKTKEEAEQKYVEYVTKLSPTWLQGGATNSSECEGEGISSSSSSSSTSAEERGFGMKVSTMQIGSEEDWAEGDDVFYYMGNGDVEKVLSFIANHPYQLRDVDSEGRTLLHWAADRGCMEVVECLLETDPEYPIHAKDQDDLTPLDYAFICEVEEIARLLVKKGALLCNCQPDTLEDVSEELRVELEELQHK